MHDYFYKIYKIRLYLKKYFKKINLIDKNNFNTNTNKLNIKYIYLNYYTF